MACVALGCKRCGDQDCGHPKGAHHSGRVKTIEIQDLTSPTKAINPRAFISEAQKGVQRARSFKGATAISNAKAEAQTPIANRRTFSIASTSKPQTTGRLPTTTTIQKAMNNTIVLDKDTVEFSGEMVLYTKERGKKMRKESPTAIWKIDDTSEEITDWEEYLVRYITKWHPAWLFFQQENGLEWIPDWKPNRGIGLMGGEVTTEKGDPPKLHTLKWKAVYKEKERERKYLLRLSTPTILASSIPER
ncbi:hypothetical protein DFH27DRAFT_603337 [Peziza echinospora]|nr:hypothetical protein DFH27DRAFT_603337 [Peziza echinospora]